MKLSRPGMTRTFLLNWGPTSYCCVTFPGCSHPTGWACGTWSRFRSSRRTWFIHSLMFSLQFLLAVACNKTIFSVRYVSGVTISIDLNNVIWRIRGSEKYLNGNSFICWWEEFFYSSLVIKSPATSSSVTSFPSSPSSQSAEESGRTGRVARDFFFVTLALGLPPMLVVAMGMGMGMGTCFANHSSWRQQSDSSTCFDTITCKAWSISCFRASNLATQSDLSSDMGVLRMGEVLGGLHGAKAGSCFSKTGSLCAASVSDSFNEVIEREEGGKTYMLAWSEDSVSKVSSLYFASTFKQSSNLMELFASGFSVVGLQQWVSSSANTRRQNRETYSFLWLARAQARAWWCGLAKLGNR